MVELEVPIEEGVISEDKFLKDRRRVEGLIEIDGIVYKAIKYRTVTQLRSSIETLDLK